jgi:leucyl aminopeptidase
MPNHQVPFRLVTPDDRSTRNLMLPLFSGAESNRALLTRFLGDAMAQSIIDLMASEHISADYKEFNLLPAPAETGFEWVLFMGLGKRASIRTDYRLHDRIRSIVASAARHFRLKHRLTFAMPDLSDLGIDPLTAGRLISEGATLGLYRFERYKSEGNRKYPDGRNIEAIHILAEPDAHPTLQRALAYGDILSVNTCHARDLVNTPALDLTPKSFAEEARRAAKQTPGLDFELLQKVHMEVERLSLHLAVARGSENEPCVVILTYQPRGEAVGYDLALVGKGVTFDAGGYNLKPTGSIERMYGDMGGAAAVLGAMRSIAQLKLPINVVGVMPLAENLISGAAYKPGDVLLSRKGLTVEITNTDAEGRLLLADSLSYTCERFKPRYILDIATLTGAIRVALGNFVTGLFTHSRDQHQDDRLAKQLSDAGHDTGEWLWRLPVDDDYLVQLASNKADIENASTDPLTGAGAITAAVFLKQFIDFDVVKAWAHLDIAATSMMLRALIYNKTPYLPREGATGIGVRLFTRFAERIAAEVSGN